jgi:hypothetical protein
VKAGSRPRERMASTAIWWSWVESMGWRGVILGTVPVMRRWFSARPVGQVTRLALHGSYAKNKVYLYKCIKTCRVRINSFLNAYLTETYGTF